MYNEIINELKNIGDKFVYEIDSKSKVLKPIFIDDFSIETQPFITIEKTGEEEVKVTYISERKEYKHINCSSFQERCGIDDGYVSEDYDLDYNNYTLTEQISSISITLKQLKEAIKTEFENWIE